MLSHNILIFILRVEVIMLYLQVPYQRLNRHCSFREIFAERALMRTIVQFFFAKPAFGNPPGGYSDPVLIRSGNFSDKRDDSRKRTFRTISKRMPPPAVSPPPIPARPPRRDARRRVPAEMPGEEARRRPRSRRRSRSRRPSRHRSRRRAGSARPAASARAQKNRHRQRCRTPFQVYREETTPDPSWGPCLRGSKEPESRSCPRCSRSGRCSPAASAAAAWHVRG